MIDATDHPTVGPWLALRCLIDSQGKNLTIEAESIDTMLIHHQSGVLDDDQFFSLLKRLGPGDCFAGFCVQQMEVVGVEQVQVR